MHICCTFEYNLFFCYVLQQQTTSPVAVRIIGCDNINLWVLSLHVSVLCLPPVDKASYMVGSYGPRAEEHEFLSPVDEAPKGVLTRGHYLIKSCFIDDDKNIYLAWEWNLDIKKDWSE